MDLYKVFFVLFQLEIHHRTKRGKGAKCFFLICVPLCSVVDFQLEQNKKNFVEVHPMNIPPSLVWISLDVLRGRSKCEKFTDDNTSLDPLGQMS
jgi:hypothetical protein